MPDGIFSNQESHFRQIFGGFCNGRCWYVLRTFVLFYGDLIYFMTIWYFWGNLVYISPILVYCTVKNLATLHRSRPRECRSTQSVTNGERILPDSFSWQLVGLKILRVARVWNVNWLFFERLGLKLLTLLICRGAFNKFQVQTSLLNFYNFFRNFKGKEPIVRFLNLHTTRYIQTPALYIHMK
jgi:hypothetical protein